MELSTVDAVQRVFDGYPAEARQQLQRLRELILASANEEGVAALDECLKWGQPSYVAKGGSTVRLAWQQDSPDEVSLLFHCQSRLVDTFREIYPDVLSFSGNRAILLHVDDVLPEQEIKHCVALALSYHRRKHLPLLGA